MALNFADAVQVLADELHESEDDINLRRHLVRSLRHHRSMKFLFSERTATMQLQSGKFEYGLEDGIPGDVLKFNSLTLQTSADATQRIALERQISIAEMRRLHSSTNSTGYPEWWCWFAQKLFFYPTPSSDNNFLTMDIQCDFTRDEEGGAEIREESDRATNVFIRDAEEALVARAGYTYSLTIQRDAEKAQLFSVAHAGAVKNLMRERDIMKLGGAQVAAYGL
jgi:hypothetical protein